MAGVGRAWYPLEEPRVDRRAVRGAELRGEWLELRSDPPAQPDRLARTDRSAALTFTGQFGEPARAGGQQTEGAPPRIAFLCRRLRGILPRRALRCCSSPLPSM